MSDGGLTIDLSGLREVTVDPERKLVHAGGGCLLGNVDAATAPHGLIVPAAIMSETGVASLRHRHPLHLPGLRFRPDVAHRGLGL